MIDLSPTTPLLTRILDSWRPDQIWLFGSRARGSATGASDWDFLVVVPDDLSDDALDPLVAWEMRRRSGVLADIIPCRTMEFHEDSSTPNTLAYEAAKQGVLVYER